MQGRALTAHDVFARGAAQRRMIRFGRSVLGSASRLAPTVRGHVDLPADGDLVQRHGFLTTGWAFADRSDLRRVEAFIDGEMVSASSVTFERSDVGDALGVPQAAESGFAFTCLVPERLRERKTIRLTVTAQSETSERITIGERWLRFSDVDYRLCSHGEVFADNAETVLRRNDVYGSGPPSAAADPLAVQLIRRYLRRDERIIDVGCGIGAYGRVLTPDGYDWTGCEVRTDFCDVVSALGLRSIPVDGERLPLADASYDAAICIEVLEHIDDYIGFVAEVRRVVKRRALFSVPSFESIPMMFSQYTIPWHMLESDHKSFFTHRSFTTALRSAFSQVEVFAYGPLERVSAVDGLPIFNHLFAVADV